MAKGLTEKQQQILDFIVRYIEEKGYPPSIREIGNAFNISSLRGVTVHLDALQRKGKITRLSTSRSITVVGHTGPSTRQREFSLVPLVGTIAAGQPITATQNIEGYVPVPPNLRANGNLFALRVRGDSMIDAHILDGDIVIVKEQSTANNGDIVAVLLGDEATVKQIQFTPQGAKLIAANPAYPPIPIQREDSRIMGKVVGLIRNYESVSRF
ncbi:SOS regulatory protein LexA [Chthonomonas calidirosea]|uniref:LexA repressor n=1 Tax=Chthonomonas calidirosea (strain DSM 23976 / ICMP 18418 / T49) TaxID=1303518 RepID=S0ES98_CHTCT|nr:transcriptional repressor LexA [Chthonomonas calidirosea]CCW33974.1 SOS regulatory protein LexA [Chthonomonas calidirosea T49]CEK15004.1 SOS regulatory protein LexA [Chthonomonas calidirosea]CEK15005.1 SOS regulatory protein LexA [Chthonomonas calidirosea]CEK16126.1 SOS regulatory protein LexA [Chthonomonas calidirosea]